MNHTDSNVAAVEESLSRAEAGRLLTLYVLRPGDYDEDAEDCTSTRGASRNRDFEVARGDDLQSCILVAQAIVLV